MSDSNELHEMQQIAHQYRNSLAAYEARTGRAPQTVDQRGSGEEKQLFARMDADLTAIELRAQLKATEDRLAKLESAPTLESRVSGKSSSAQDEYAARWIHALATGDAMAMRTLTAGATGGGLTAATTIPTDMERRIVERMRQANVLRQLGRVSTIDSKRTIPVENALPSTSLVAENGSITPADPSFSTSISVVPYKFVTAVTMTQEYIEDAIGNGGIGGGLQYVADKCGLSIGLKQEEYMTVGTGSGEPEGIETTSITQNVNIGAGGAGNAADTDLTADMIINAVHAVPPQYRTGPKFAWVMHDSVVATIRKLKAGGATGEYLWRPAEAASLSGGAPGAIYGVPYYIDQYMNTATDTTNSAVVAVVGNFDYFEIFDRTGITSMIDPYSGAGNHRTTLYVYTRFDSHVMLPEAFAQIIV